MVAQEALRASSQPSLECQRGFLPQKRTRVLNTLPAFKLGFSDCLWVPEDRKLQSKVTALSLLGLPSF